jgi:hypothetical protein
MSDVSDRAAAKFWTELEEAIKPVMARQPKNVLRWASERTDPQTWFQELAVEALHAKRRKKRA